MAQTPAQPATKPPAKKVSPLQFAREVRAEVRKITWATRQETMVSTIFVFIMVAIAALFFFLADLALRSGVGALIGLGGGR